MSARADYAIDPFSDLALSEQVLTGLYERLNAIKQAPNTQQVYLNTEKAESFVEALDMMDTLSQRDILSIYQVIEAIAQARTIALIL